MRGMRWGVLVVVLSGMAAGGMAQSPSSLVINEFMASNTAGFTDGLGAHPDWIEIRNPTATAISVSGCYMSDDKTRLNKWPFPTTPTITVPANGYLVVVASDNASGTTPYIDSLGYVHTTFKLAASGESVILTAADGTTVISSFIDYPSQGADISYGIGSNGATGYLKTPTPGAANSAAADGQVADTDFSVHRGIYSTPFTVAITTATAGATIRYTLDGSTPTETNGTVYSTPISVSATTTLRAFAYRTNWFPTNVDTQTYIFLSSAISQPATKPSAAWPDPYKPSGGGGGGGTSGSQAIDYAMDTKVTADSRYADLMDDALLAIPSMSIVTDLPNLFNATTGIYANPTNEGDAWERPASVELINPDGSTGFQVDAGIRIRGGVSAGKSNPKHSFRVIMKSDYGDSKIDYPLLGPDGPQSFDKVDFRTAQNYSWNLSSAQYATWLDDPFSHDLMRDMGHPSTEGFFFHLYLNGLYWGLYQTEERPDAYFAKSHMGGEEENYDVVKADEDTGQMYATDGTTAFYFAFWTAVNAGVTTPAAYYKLQGKNADGTLNATYPRYLDPTNLADYMLLVFFTGAQDMPLGPPNSGTQPRNLYAIADRVAGDGFKFLPHDNEWSLLQQSGVNANRITFTPGTALNTQVNFNPWTLHNKLKTNAEYAIHFADRIHKHFFNGGALTPASCTARYTARKNEIDMAIIAESARWGDYLTSTNARDRIDDWLPAVNWVLNSYFNATPSTRTAVVLAQLKTAGLYPSLDAPEFSQFGGNVAAGYTLTITGPATGTIYYTTDGSDPRQIGGAVLGTARSGASGLTTTIATTSTVKARTYNSGTWSAITEATFTTPATPTSTPTATPSPTPTATPSPTASPTPTVAMSDVWVLQ